MMLLKKLLRKLNANKVRKQDEFDVELSSNLQETISTVRMIIGESSDVVERDIIIGNHLPAALFYIKGLCNEDTLDNNVLKPLIQLQKQKLDLLKAANFKERVIKEVLTLDSITVYDTFDQAILQVLSGETLLIIEGVKKLILLDTQGYDKRSIEEPQSEVLVRGPRDGFIEDIQTNTMLIRRRIKDPNLIIQTGKLGRRSKKTFALAYLKGIVSEDLVEEIRYRIACIDMDDVYETGTLEQLIEDNFLSVFPQVLHTERPDRTVHHIMNGHVIILLDGTPFSLITPMTFAQLLKSPEDYYDHWTISSLIRLLRFGAMFLAIFLPGLYIALVSFHQGMIPSTLALSIAGSREGVPFPAFVEALVMEVTLELLREAGLRLPRPVGQTIGIVGGLVIGESAVRAGIVSPIMVIVVAITAIASFAIPAYNVSIAFRILRFAIMIAAASFGLYGIIIVYIMINIHLVGLRSFGSYYLSPFAPYHFIDWLDLFIRAPLSLNRLRTAVPPSKESKRQD